MLGSQNFETACDWGYNISSSLAGRMRPFGGLSYASANPETSLSPMNLQTSAVVAKEGLGPGNLVQTWMPGFRAYIGF